MGALQGLFYRNANPSEPSLPHPIIPRGGGRISICEFGGEGDTSIQIITECKYVSTCE